MRVERFPVTRAVRLAARFAAAFAIVFLMYAGTPPASAQVLDRIKQTGQIRFGYVTDGRPFAFRNEAGEAEGYVIDLCRHIAGQVESQLALPTLRVEWIPLGADARTRAVREGGIDLMCTPVVPTLARRKEVSFSIPVFAGGNRAVIRKDSSQALRTTLEGTASTQPVWRGSPAAKLLQRTIFAVVSGTTSESWLAARGSIFQIDAEVLDVLDYRDGLEKLLDHRVDVLFGDRAVLLGAMSEAAHERLVILDRLFTQEPYALPLARDDEDFRLLVDGALSELYASDGFGNAYAQWYGEFDDATRSFFLWNTFPEHAQAMTSTNRQAALDMKLAHVRVAEE
jgi:polar amino acid transport system substrate-binding protein